MEIGLGLGSWEESRNVISVSSKLQDPIPLECLNGMCSFFAIAKVRKETRFGPAGASYEFNHSRPRIFDVCIPLPRST